MRCRHTRLVRRMSSCTVCCLPSLLRSAIVIHDLPTESGFRRAMFATSSLRVIASRNNSRDCVGTKKTTVCGFLGAVISGQW